MAEKRTLAQLVSRQSEITEALAKIATAEDTPEVRSEAEALHNELATIQPELRQAAAKQEADAEARLQGDGDPVAPELRQLYERAKVGDVFAHALGQRSIDGATAELQQELGLTGNTIPSALIFPEVRTSGQTPAPTDHGASQSSIIPAVFPTSAYQFLDVDTPTVPVGDAVYTVLTTNLQPGLPAGGAEQAHSAGAFTATVMEPSRIQGSFFFRREDRARLAGMEESLRENLNMAMNDKMDSEIVGANGFLAASGGLTARSGDAATEATFAVYRGFVYDSATIDGSYASMSSDVKLLMGPHTYSHAGAKYRGNNSDDSAIDSLMRISGGARVSAHIPDPASNDQDVIVVKGSGRRNAVAPMWQGIEVIYDEITQAKSGEIVITAVMLWGGLEILRSAGYVRRVAQVA